jgi:integrase
VVEYIAQRRIGHSPGTVNGELLFLNQIVKRGREIWDVATPIVRIRDFLLPEPDYRQHILAPTEEERLFGSLRQDMQGMVCFAMATGLRLSNVIYLKWDQIKWELGHIEFRVKSKKQGGKVHLVPLTDFIIHLLEAEKGNHSEYVFTLTALKDNTNWITGERFFKGARYPYTRSGSWRKLWEQALKDAQLWEKGSGTNFRFHDLRHTAATRLYKATRNLKLVQRFLGHATIQMTLRYLGIDVEDLRDGMDLIKPAHFGHALPANPETPPSCQ